MKWSVLLLLAVLVFVVAQEEEEVNRMYIGLAYLFSIKIKEVEKCILKFGASPGDLSTFSDVVYKGNDNNGQTERIKRASCALACCAQVQGTMKGAKLDLPEIRKLVTHTHELPEDVRKTYLKSINECGEQVKDVAEACETVVRFGTCLAQNARDSNESE